MVGGSRREAFTNKCQSTRTVISFYFLLSRCCQPPAGVSLFVGVVDDGARETYGLSILPF